MVKYSLIILLGLNALVLAWQWDAFAHWGHGPNRQREPERLQQQVRPEALKFEPIAPAPTTADSAAVEASAQAKPLPLEASVPDQSTQAPTAVPTPASAASPTAPR